MRIVNYQQTGSSWASSSEPALPSCLMVCGVSCLGGRGWRSMKGSLYRLEGTQAHSGRAGAEPFLTMPSEVISIQSIPPGPHANRAQLSWQLGDACSVPGPWPDAAGRVIGCMAHLCVNTGSAIFWLEVSFLTFLTAVTFKRSCTSTQYSSQLMLGAQRGWLC